jgi:hypothetical protein
MHLVVCRTTALAQLTHSEPSHPCFPFPPSQALAYIPAAQVHLQDVICRWTIAYT